MLGTSLRMRKKLEYSSPLGGRQRKRESGRGRKIEGEKRAEDKAAERDGERAGESMSERERAVSRESVRERERAEERERAVVRE